MARIAVLGTIHDVQGAQKRKGHRLNDARYREVLEKLLHGRDFVFEEATGLGPTTAEVRCNELLGSGRYLDVDPAVEYRAAYGITENTGEPRYVRPCDPDGFTYNSESIRPQAARENLWLHRIRENKFENGLLVCGFLHTLSMSFKLLTANYTVEAFHFLPWEEFCQRQRISEHDLR